MELHATILLLAGMAIMAMAVLPKLTPDWTLSTPIIVLGFGLLVFTLPLGLPHIDPIKHGDIAEYVAEFAVLVALMGAGLRIDRRVGWLSWRSTWLLLGVTMPLTIAAAALLGWLVVGLAPAAALLLGAALAPTDPVLASEVQVGPPGQGAEHEGRVGFALTSEAGLNDGLAFPFVHAALAMAVATGTNGDWVAEWLLVDVAWRIGIGVLGGWLVGRTIGRLLFGPEMQLSRYSDGLAALGATLLTYGLIELLHGYGFLAVFVAAYMVRDSDRGHEHHATLNRLIEQVEDLSLTLVLFLLAGAVISGVLAPLTWQAAAVGLAVIFVVRPLAGLAVFAAPDLRGRAEPLATAWFGIRGVGSIYYVAWGVNHDKFDDPELLWATIVFVVLVSVFVHGITATPVMRRLKRRRRWWQVGPRATL